MDFTKIRLKGFTDVDLPVQNALPSDPYILKSVDGLGAPNVDVFISKSSSGKSYFQRSSPQNRELVFRIILNPDYSSGQTVTEMRDTLYGLLTGAVSDLVTVQIMSDTVIEAQTTGYVKTLDSILFTKDPEVQIIIPCLEPYFYKTAQHTTVLGSAEWPSPWEPRVLNIGTAPAFFDMELTFHTGVSSWTITDAAGEFMAFNSAFSISDKLYFNTIPGERMVAVTRGGTTTTHFEILSSDSTWLSLRGGQNVFAAGSQYGLGTITYKPQYWGV